jgi:hypothetical protein
MVINKTTREERLVVENAMWSIIAEIDTANQILMNLWERYFGMVRQNPLNESDAENIGNTLQLCNDKIFDALLEYALTTGNKDFRGVSPHVRSAEKEAAVLAIEDAIREIEEKEKYMSQAERDASIAKRAHLSKLPDDEALPLLHAMLKEENHE